MKKVMIALALAGSLAAVAAEEPAVAASAAPAASQAQLGPRVQRRAPMTEEQRAKMRAQREKFMAERKAAMEAKALPIIKKYGLDDEKAKALFGELQEAMRTMPPPRRRSPMREAPKAPKAAAPAPAAS